MQRKLLKKNNTETNGTENAECTAQPFLLNYVLVFLPAVSMLLVECRDARFDQEGNYTGTRAGAAAISETVL